MSLNFLSTTSLQQHLYMVECLSTNRKPSDKVWITWDQRLEATVCTTFSNSSNVSGEDANDDDGESRGDEPNPPVVSSVYASWNLPLDIQVVSLATDERDEALRFVGRVGSGVRSVQAPWPLPKPRQYTLFTPKSTPLQPMDRKKRRRRRNKKVVQVLPEPCPTRVTCRPFSQPFTLVDGTLRNEDRLVSYYEVNILESSSYVYTDVSEVCSFSEMHIFEDESDEEGDLFQKHGRRPECVAVGIATADFDLARSMPGWEAKSFGFYSIDGAVFANEKHSPHFGDAYGAGDVVGCGVDYKEERVFFTKNGEFEGYAEESMEPAEFAEIKWIPTIGLDAHHLVQVNTSGPFLFDFLALSTESRTMRAHI